MVPKSTYKPLCLFVITELVICHLMTVHLKHKTITSRITKQINPLTPELNPSAQRCLTRYFAGFFAS
jgi:hypothetical protein